MNLSLRVKYSCLLPSLFSGRHIARLARRGAAINLALLSLAAGASAQDVKPLVPPPAAPSADWLRMREGLKKAKPIPEPSHAIRPSALTPSGDLVRFDPATGRVSTLAPAKAEMLNPAVTRHPGQQWVPPTPADGNSRVIRGSSSDDLGVRGIIPLTITPTPPRPLLQPYIFEPYLTEFRLLMRFTVPGASDQFYLCSASSVSSFHLLSAAHCVYNHDPLGNGSGRGAGYAAEIWAWPAETDFADPRNPISWPDFPWGVAKMTFETTYTGWINNSDLNWDFSFITLDRRIGDHIGWMGREWGVTTPTLFYSGYPAEAPYVSPDNPFQYPGADDGNVIGYTCCRIQMSAFTYGGHSGGGVFRCCASDGFRMLQGVNSTSTRAGYAEATLFRGQNNTDLVNTINVDRAARPTVDRAQLIEYVFDDDSKGLLATSVAIGEFLPFKINAFNAGYASAGTVTADIYLTHSFDVLSGTYIGSILLGDLNANSFIISNTFLAVPTFVPPGTYYVGWRLRGTNAQYGTDNDTALITKDQVRMVGLNAVLTNPNTVVGGTSSTGLVQLTDLAPPNGVGDGIDVLLSSSSPAVQFVNSVHIKQGFKSGAFNITTAPVKQNTTVTITANLKGITRTTSLLITPKAGPAALNSVALAPPSVVGGNNSTATVSLTAPAPAGGITVNLASSNVKAIVPKTVLVPAGSATATFQVKTTAVTAMAAATIKATYSGVTKTAVLSIKPLQPAAVTLAPPTLKGGAHSVATITTNGPAPGGATIALASSNPHATVPKTVHVNPGSSSVTVTVNTTAVTAATVATIKATSFGLTKSANLTIKP